MQRNNKKNYHYEHAQKQIMIIPNETILDEIVTAQSFLAHMIEKY